MSEASMSVRSFQEFKWKWVVCRRVGPGYLEVRDAGIIGAVVSMVTSL